MDAIVFKEQDAKNISRTSSISLSQESKHDHDSLNPTENSLIISNKSDTPTSSKFPIYGNDKTPLIDAIEDNLSFTSSKISFHENEITGSNKDGPFPPIVPPLQANPLATDKNTEETSTDSGQDDTVIKFRLTIEPAVLLFTLAMAFQMIMGGTLLTYLVCRNTYGYNETECRNITSESATSTSVQNRVADYSMYRSIVEVVPSTILCFFIGAWSDKHGRKIVLIFPMIGFFLSACTFLAASSIPDVPPELFVLGSIFVGCFGNLACFFIATFGYIVDITNLKIRTIRIAIVDLALGGALAIGLSVSGIIYTAGGFAPVFITQGAFALLAIIYVIFFVKESVQSPPPMTKIQRLRDLFQWQNIANTFQIVLKQREGNQRGYILSMIAAVFVLIWPMGSEGQVAFLYVSKIFKWSQTDYGIFMAYSIVVSCVGVVILMKFVLKRFKVPDVLIGLIAVTGIIIKKLFCALSPVGWLFYIGATVSFFDPLSLPIIRSALSKLVSSADQGKVLAFVTTCETISPVVGTLVYTQVYKATSGTYPSTIFFVTVGVMIIPATVFSWIYFDLRAKKLTINEIAEQNRRASINDEPTPTAVA